MAGIEVIKVKTGSVVEAFFMELTAKLLKPALLTGHRANHPEYGRPSYL